MTTVIFITRRNGKELPAAKDLRDRGFKISSAVGTTMEKNEGSLHASELPGTPTGPPGNQQKTKEA